jgi:hypothetical protein
VFAGWSWRNQLGWRVLRAIAHLAPVISLLLATRLSYASPGSEPKPDYFVGASYGMGLNMWPNTDSGEKPLFSDLALTLGIGLPAETPNFLVEFEIAGLLGHNNQTDSDVLFGTSLRVAPWRHSFVRFRGDVQLRNQAPRTTIVGLYAGVTSVGSAWLSSAEVGWIVGEHRDNGYINLVELRVGFSRDLRIGK